MIPIAMALVIMMTPSVIIADDSDYMVLVEQFFDAVRAGKAIDGIDKLYGTNPWIARNQDSIDQLKSQFVSLPNTVGKYIGHELVIEKNLKNRLIYLNYLVLYERQPVRFEIHFYRPGEKWTLYSFSFDDAIDADLTTRGRIEAAKLADP